MVVTAAIVRVPAVRVPSGMVFVPVMPQFSFVKKEEKNQANQQSRKQLLHTGLAFEGLGQQVHEGGGQQRASGQTEHVRGVAGQHASAQQRCQPHTSNAGRHCSRQNCYQSHIF